MANRDHDQNPNQNPNRSGKVDQGDRNQQSQNPVQKPGQRPNPGQQQQDAGMGDVSRGGPARSNR